MVSNEIKEIFASDKFYVFVPGLVGGGKNLSVLRLIPNIFVPSSIFTRQGLKKDELSLNDHHEGIGREIIKKAQGRDIVMMMHSAGSFEGLDILLSMLKTGFNNHINLVFMGTPGLTSKGIKGGIDFIHRFIEINLQVATSEQHVIYPLPEVFYQQQINTAKPKIPIAFEDTSIKREQRRKIFVDSIRNHPTILKGQSVDKLLEDLNKIDEKISVSNNSNDWRKLVEKRASLLGPIIQEFFKGKQVGPTLHEKLMKEYHELPEDLSSLSKYCATAMLYLAKTSFVLLGKGTDDKLTTILKLAKKTGIDVGVSFLVAENDQMIRPADIEKIEQRLTMNNKDMVIIFSLIQNFDHSGYGINSQPLEELTSGSKI